MQLTLDRVTANTIESSLQSAIKATPTPSAKRRYTSESFWEMAGVAKMEEKVRIDQNLKSLEYMPLETLKKVLIQYRFFTHYYISDMAILISKLPFGQLRTIMADILNEELGMGDANDSHPALYDAFLLSIGIPQEQLEVADTYCLRNLSEIQESLLSQSWAYGVGLRGMGGECLCQIYLSTMHEYFSKNPAIVEMQEDIAWKFWEIHIGEVDLHHQRIVKAAIDNLIVSDPDLANDLIEGYKESQGAWDRFWQQIFKAANQSRMHVAAPLVNNYTPAMAIFN